jgi:beta-lactam-binding protein with PASTA domain
LRAGIAVFACSLAMLLSDPAARALGAPATFEDVSDKLGPLGSQITWGAAWGDIDGDGWPDAFLSNHYRTAPFVLRNQGGASFADVSLTSGASVKSDHHTCKWADYDRDRDWDLYCSTGKNHGTTLIPSRLLRNRGDGRFDDVAIASNVDFQDGRSRAMNWLDIEGDGDLDIFYGTLVESQVDPLSRLYRNDGATFTDITASAGLQLDGRIAVSLAFDYDKDNDDDLLVTFLAREGVTVPCTSCLLFLRNEGGGAFSIVKAPDLGLTGQSPRTVALGDFDNDGDLDVFQGTDAPSAKLHRNNGNLTFSSVSLTGAGLTHVADFPIHDARWADFDNDGDLDLYVVHSSTNGRAQAPNQLYLSNGNGTFSDGTTQFNAGGTTLGAGDAVAIADFDRNGFLDLLIANGFEETSGPYQLLRNTGNGNHWLRVIPTNAHGSPEFGSKVSVRVGGTWQFREYSDSYGPRSSDEPVAHFGLGEQTQAELVRVQWRDGSTTEVAAVAADQQIEVQRSGNDPTPVDVPDVVGMTQQGAGTALAAAGLVAGSVTHESSETVPVGHVIRQSPTAGESVASGTSVDLVISTGAPVTVPDVVGLGESAASAAIADAGLAVGQIIRQASETTPAGDVIDQTPAAGTSVAAGSLVDLVVSSGAPALVPDVVGLSQQDAGTALSAAGFSLGSVTQSPSTTVPSGTVISQNPAAGASAAAGSAVALVVSSGLPTVTVPNVAGLAQSAAGSALTGVGLVVGAVTQQPSATVPLGSVVSQAPVAGAIVAWGSSVDLIVSSGPATVAYAVAPTSLAFGNQTVNVTSSAQAITLSNIGAVPLSITSIALNGTNPGQFAQTHNCGSSVAAGGSCTIQVTFKPTSAGAKTANLVITTTGGAGNKTVPLSGTGVTAAYTVSPASLAFGSLPRRTTSATQTVSVANIGVLALTITSITLAGPNKGQFAQANDCPAQLGPAAACTISVVFKPTSAGAKSATLKVTPSGVAAKSVALTGTGI